MINESKAPVNHYFDEKINNYFNCFWLGFILYTAAFCYNGIARHNYVFALPFQSVGLILIVFSSIKLIKFNIKNNYLKFLYVAYCLWSFSVLFRGFVFESQFVKDMLFDAEFGLFPFLVPLILLFPQNIFFYKKLFKVICILGIIFIIYDIIFIRDILDVSNYFTDVSSTKYAYEHFVKSLSVTTGFLILAYTYQSDKIKWFAFFVVGLTILLAIIRARRALLFLSISPLMIAAIFYFFLAKKKFLMLLILVFVTSAIFIIGFKKFSADKHGIFGLLMERADADSRTPVELCFYQDMMVKDWIIGKGINGEYYCPDIDQIDKTGYRDMIETDYLNIILKGGIVSIVLLLLIIIPAMIKGLFYSKNLLSKAAAVWIFLWIIDLFPATVYTFTLNYILVWIAVGICYNKRIRNMPEELLKFYFLNIDKISKNEISVTDKLHQ